jgi:hypothetical protein
MVEIFLVESWLDHLRQHERVKTADRALQDLVNQFQTDGTAPAIRTSLLGSGIDGRDRVFALPSIIVLPGGIRNDDAKKSHHCCSSFSTWHEARGRICMPSSSTYKSEARRRSSSNATVPGRTDRGLEQDGGANGVQIEQKNGPRKE